MNSGMRVVRRSGSMSCTRRLANWSPRDPGRLSARSLLAEPGDGEVDHILAEVRLRLMEAVLQVGDEPLHPLGRRTRCEVDPGEQDLPLRGGERT